MNEELSTLVAFIAGAVLAKNWSKIKRFLPKVSISELAVYLPFVGEEREGRTHASAK